MIVLQNMVIAKRRGTSRGGQAASNNRRGHHSPHPIKATSETKCTMATRPPPGFDDCAPINVGLALDLNAQSSMALNNNNPPPNNIHPNFLESPVAGNNATNNVMPRLIASPLSQQPQHQINNNNNGNGIGMNGPNMGMSMNAGHQMDVNMLYQKVVELSEVLKENREKTQGIISGAEELAVCVLPFRPETALRHAPIEIGEPFPSSSCFPLIQDILRQQARAAVNGVNPSLQEASATVTCEANPTAFQSFKGNY